MRAKAVTAEEQYRLIMECRASGMTDYQWCVEHNDQPCPLGAGAFYTERAAMLGDITAADEIYIVCGYTDMRRSIDGLCAIVQDRLRMDPRRRALYLWKTVRQDQMLIMGKRWVPAPLQTDGSPGPFPVAEKP